MQVIERTLNSSSRHLDHVIYFGSDVHFGGDDFDRPSFVRYMDMAKARGAEIYLIGDIIGGITPWDKRSTSRTETHKQDDFVNHILTNLVTLFTPYREHIHGIGIGNHEYTFIQKTGVDPVRLLVDSLNAQRQNPVPIQYMDYCGFLWFKIRFTGNRRISYKAFYHHGTSSNAPVTEGLIAAKRLVEGVDGVDCLVVGHTHKNWSVRNERFFLNDSGQIVVKPVRIISTGSHQRAYKFPDEPGLAWSETKGFRASPFGGAFLRLNAHRLDTSQAGQPSITLDATVEH